MCTNVETNEKLNNTLNGWICWIYVLPKDEVNLTIEIDLMLASEVYIYIYMDNGLS